MTTDDTETQRPETEYKGVIIRTYDVPCTPFVWTHDELDGGGQAETMEEAQRQIDDHLKQVEKVMDDAFTKWTGDSRCPDCQGWDCDPDQGCRYGE